MQVEDNIAIDEIDIEQEILMVRGKALNELVCNITFTAAIYHVLTGKLPDAIQEKSLNKFMVQCAKELINMKKEFQAMKVVLISKPEIESLMMIGLLLFDQTARNRLTKLSSIALSDIREAVDGLFFMALLPVVICLALTDLAEDDFYNLIEDCSNRHSNNFTAMTLALLSRGKESSVENIALMDGLLVSLHAGFGIITPIIVLSRFSASTRASIAKNIVAGFTGCGLAHVGACKAAMTLLKKLNSEDAAYSDATIRNIIYAEKPIPGFGHPILHCDPRNKMLASLVQKSKNKRRYFYYYQQLVDIVMHDYQLQPNIDLIAASILLDLDIDPAAGTAIFLFARVPTIIAHALEKQKAPPFGISKKDAREHFSVLPKRWI